MTFVFLLLGLAAGALTTLAGQGGGLLLLLACGVIVSPQEALAITAPALLFGNLHRALLLRAHIERPVALRLIVGAVPGAVVGGLLAGMAPAWALRIVLIGMTAVALAKALGYLHFRVSSRALLPAGAVVGAMTGTSGGAGILFAPVLLSAGLSGKAFVATSAAIAFATHVGRVAGYAGLGLFSLSLLGKTLAVTSAIFVGNALGGRVHSRMTTRTSTFLEYATLVVCVVLSVVGMG